MVSLRKGGARTGFLIKVRGRKTIPARIVFAAAGEEE